MVVSHYVFYLCFPSHYDTECPLIYSSRSELQALIFDISINQPLNPGRQGNSQLPKTVPFMQFNWKLHISLIVNQLQSHSHLIFRHQHPWCRLVFVWGSRWLNYEDFQKTVKSQEDERCRLNNGYYYRLPATSKVLCWIISYIIINHVSITVPILWMKKLANIDCTNSPIMKEQRMATGDVNIFRCPREARASQTWSA